MKQRFLLKTMLLLCALVAGSSSVWATTYKLQQVTSVSAGNLYVFEQDGYVMNNTISSSALQTTNSYKTTGLAGTETYVWTLQASNSYYKMKNVSITSTAYYLTNGSSTNVSLANSGSEWAFNFQTDGTVMIQNHSNSDRYLGYTNSTSHAYKAYATSSLTYAHAIKVYQLVEETNAVATPTFSVDAGSYSSAQNVELSCTTDGATIYYTMGNDPADPTSASTPYTGAISVTSSTTIKAIAIKGSDVSSIATATYTIVSFEHAGTEADPYNVADARTAIDASLGVTGVYATGTVSEIVTAYNSTYKNITFNISTDGTTTSDQLQAYRCKGATGIDASEVQVGDIVVITGNLKKHGETYEFEENCEITSLDHPVVPLITATPTSLADFTYVAGNGPSAAQTISVEGTNLKANISLSLGESSNYELSLDESVYSNTLTLTQTAGTVAATTVYVRLKEGLAVAAEYNGTITLTSTDAINKIVSLTGSVTAPEIPNFTWDLSTDQTATATTTEITWTSAQATMRNDKGSATTATNNYYPGTEGQTYSSTRFYKNSVLTINPALCFSITSIVFTATTTGYATTLKNSAWTNAAAAVDAKDDKVVIVTPTDGSSAISATIGGTCGFTAVKIYYEIATTTTATFAINAACKDNEGKYYGTFSIAKSFVVPEGLTVSEIGVTDGKLAVSNYATGAIVPANTGVMVSATSAGDKTVTLSDAAGTSVLGSDNMLKASSVAMTGDNKFYRLTMHGETTIGFYYGAAGGAAFSIGANKAYLAVPTSSAPEFLWFNTETTSLSEELRVKSEESIYDLQGRRVVQPTKGLYIVNGRKVVIK